MDNENTGKKINLLETALLLLIIYIAFLGIQKIWHVFSAADPKLAVGLITASATIIISITSLLVSKHLDRKTVVFNHLREKKIPVYENIIHVIFEVSFAEKIGKKKPTEKEITQKIAEITQELIIWGSDEMIEAFYKFKSMNIDETENEKSDPYKILFIVEDLLLAIRKDLGHKNKNVSRGKILGLFITDLPKSINSI